MALIHEKMAAILAELKPVTKDRQNDHFKYNYRGIDDALSALNPLLAKHKVFLLPQFTETSITDADKGVRATLLLSLVFVADDGSQCVCQVPGEGIDKGDKATMKAIANAMKYAIYNTFCIPTEEKKDSEAFSDTDGVGKAPTPNKKRAAAAKKPPAKAQEGGTEAADMLKAVNNTTTKEALELLRPTARKIIQGLSVSDPDRQLLIEAFQSKIETLGGA